MSDPRCNACCFGQMRRHESAKELPTAELLSFAFVVGLAHAVTGCLLCDKHQADLQRTVDQLRASGVSETVHAIAEGVGAPEWKDKGRN